MTLTQIHDRQAGEKVKVFLAVRIPETTALTTHEGHGKTGVGSAQIFRVQINNGLVR
jgi:hypothetical protein